MTALGVGRYGSGQALRTGENAVNKTFVAFLRRTTSAGRGSLAVLVAIVMVLATATGVAVAQDSSEHAQADASDTSTSSSTSTADDPTTSTSHETSTSDDSTTTTDSDVKGKESSDDLDTASDATTTTSDALNNVVVGSPRDPPTNETCPKIESPTGGQTRTVVAGTTSTVTLTFVFNSGATGATWSSSAPFTGDIIVKAGEEPAGGGETTFSFTNATTGTVFSPFTNQNGQTLQISHVTVCGEGGTTTTTTTTTDTTTTTTDTTTTDTTTDTTTGTTTGTGGTAGTTGAVTTPAGGEAGVVGGGGGGGKGGGGEGAVAGEAAATESGLAFTGLHVPALILIALGMAGAGIVLRKKLQDAA